MKKFIVIYRASASWASDMKNASPDVHKKGMELWMAWAKKCGSALVDFGAPLGNAQLISKSGSTPSNGDVVGYSILEAESMKKAVEMLKGHPHLAWTESCKIEVLESMTLPE